MEFRVARGHHRHKFCVERLLAGRCQLPTKRPNGAQHIQHVRLLRSPRRLKRSCCGEVQICHFRRRFTRLDQYFDTLIVDKAFSVLTDLGILV